jgi:hypothetical protein
VIERHDDHDEAPEQVDRIEAFPWSPGRLYGTRAGRIDRRFRGGSGWWSRFDNDGALRRGTDPHVASEYG